MKSQEIYHGVVREEQDSAREDRDPPPSRSSAARRLPWSRALLLLAVAGPALWLGGVKPWTVPVFIVVVAAFLLRRCQRSEAPLRIPALWWLGLAAAGLTLLQWLPLPPALLQLLAPELSDTVAELIAGTSLERWSRLSVHPGQTGLEFGRLLALTGLFIAAAQLSWRLVASYVSLTGTLVALIGLTQKLVGAEAIYGLYTPRQSLPGLGQGLGAPLLTSFVNPNHQSGLLLIGLFAAAAMAVDLHQRAHETRGRDATERLADRAYLAAGAGAIQTTALVLSMSRGALVSLVLVLPVVLALVLAQPRLGGQEPGHSSRRRAVLVLVVLAMIGLALTQGAWDQLMSLGDPGTFAEKLRVAREGAALVGLSPVLGIGRGAFVDLFPLVDGAPRTLQFTHLESTPVTFIVEWGPLPGGALLLGFMWWWGRSFRANQGLSRRLALCGLAALAIQSWADFSLDFLGVAAPAVALAGSLGVSSTGRGWPRRRVVVATLIMLLAAEAVAIPSIPGSWSERRPRDRAILDGELALEPALRQTPLDARLHVILAREHAVAGDWAAARQRAEAAIRLRPASLDAHLLAAEAAALLGERLASIELVRQGLEGLREPVPETLVEWLVESTAAQPEQIADVAPDDALAWEALARAMKSRSPPHMRALARARARTHPDERAPLLLQAELELEAKNHGLALHHARLLVALEPRDETGHRLRALARFGHEQRAQDEAAVAELEAAREAGRVRDPGVIDELLIMGLLRLDDARSINRAEALLDGLLARRAKPPARKRRKALAERVRAAQARLE